MKERRMNRIKSHNYTLKYITPDSIHIALRPLTEEDWDILLRWNNDPEVLFFADSGYVASYTMEKTQRIYRGVSQKAFIFIIEYNDIPVGECWLQQMNLEWILEKFPGKDIRRIDLMIGEKNLWGKGIGTIAIKLLTEFGFKDEKADFIFGCNIADYNPRSLKAFQKVGYQILEKVRQPIKSKAEWDYFVYMDRESFTGEKLTVSPPLPLNKALETISSASSQPLLFPASHHSNHHRQH